MIEIESHIPVPIGGIGTRTKSLPYDQLKIGESFKIADITPLNMGYWQRITGFRFTSRRVIENGVECRRVWRVR